jgi:hypothetical protein
LLDSFGLTNSLFQGLFDSQSSTNSLFQSLLNSLASTNSLFQGFFTSQTDTNSAFQALHTAQAATNTIFRNLHVAQGNTNTAFESRIQDGETAYGWGDHALVGYLTASTNLFSDITTADRSVLGTNLSGLTQGTYTGALTSVSYTGVTELVIGRTYAWGFTKANAFGTSTLSIATYSLTKTAAGAASNYFTFKNSTDSNLVLRLDGNGSSKSDVSSVYVQQITNGDVNVAGDINVGGTFYVNGVDINNLPGVSTNLSDFNNDAGFITTIASSGAWNKASTDAATATNETATLRTATNSLQTQISNIGGIMYRYVAMATASEQIEVLATTTNITAARVGTTVTMTIPAGTRLLSMRLRWDGVNNGSTFNLNLGTNDMSNSGVTDRWGAMFFAYREDTGALIAGASCRLDTSNYDVLIIQGLPTACISNCRFGF